MGHACEMETSMQLYLREELVAMNTAALDMPREGLSLIQHDSTPGAAPAGAMAQAELPALYRRASLFVAPFIRDDSGNQEGLPVVLMEAIGCGCPVLVGEVAGIEDLLGDARADVCVKPGDTQALAIAIIGLLRNPEQARQRAIAIRATAADRIDWQNISDGYARELQQCIVTRIPRHRETSDSP